MKPHLIILGAGPSRGAGRPLGLQQVTLDRRVLDWQLDAFAPLAPEVSFVGGYDIALVMQSFPRLTYHFNTEWQSTGSVASLALALEAIDEIAQGQRDLYVAYSDILLRPALVEAMAAAPADRCAVAFDMPRPGQTGKLPETLHLGGELREFVGLVRVPAACTPAFCAIVAKLAAALRRDHLSRLLTNSGLSAVLPQIHGVAATDLWAHAEHGRSVARFVLGSKASTLDRLQNKLQHSSILPLCYFTRAVWLKKREESLDDLVARFAGTRSLIVRSSAIDEDGFERANAGRYHTELNVLPQAQPLGAAIDRVFGSYAAADPLDEVLVQPQLEGVRASGVIFTRVLETGSPYRVINYTESNDTTAITGGASRESVKLYVSRMAAPQTTDRLPDTGRRLLAAAEEAEACVFHDSLDIEFAIDAQDCIFTLQVRPLVLTDAYQDRGRDGEVADCLAGIHAALAELAAPSPGQVGKTAVWSVMADWNPAEIVGLTPGPLALDLYRHIITDNVWAIQRHEIGYRDLRGWPLVRSFGGQAFVDVRASINSFLPAALAEPLAQRLADHALELLRADRSLHDKLEFELLPTCLDFGFEQWHDRYLAGGIGNKAELAQLRAGLCQITRNIVARAPRDLEAARKLETRCATLERPAVPFADWLRHTLSACSLDGALVFAHLARAGFVAAALLRSAVQAGLLDEARRAALMESIPGVGSMLAQDALAVRDGRMTRAALIERFGHLRPGTYDICTPAYRDRPEAYLDPIIATAKQNSAPHFSWTPAERKALDAALGRLDIGLTAETLLEFAHTAVAGREYSKFVFTRLLSATLDALAARGRAAGIAHEKLGCMPLDAWLGQSVLAWGDAGKRAELLARTELRYRQHQLAGRILLPPVLAHPDEIFAFVVPPSEPTFVTTRRVDAALRLIQPGEVVQREAVRDCVVAIVNADPGFDYLFALGIRGLITAFGGPNSHMAIRASEFSVPAVIGIGEQAFGRLRDGAPVKIDGQQRQWQQEDTA